MIKSNKAIALVSLLITIAVMLIITSITISVSYDRFEINNLNKMLNDLEFLRDKVSNYYLRYGVLPLLRDAETNQPIIYESIEFEPNANDNGNYYIIDLKAMDGISLNYGLEIFNNPGTTSDDVYIINEKSHNIYYPRGIEWDGEKYYSIADTTELTDTIPPSKPEIKVISGKQNEEGTYTTEVTIEIIPGKDNVSGIEKTTYSINDETEKDISTLTNNILKFTDDNTYNIIVRSYDKNGNISEDPAIIEIKKVYNFAEYFRELEYIESTGTQYIDTGFVPNSNTSIEMKFSNYSTANATLYCARGANGLSDNSYTAFLIGGTNLRVDYNTKQYQKLYNAEKDKIYTLKQSKNQVYINDTLLETLDNVVYSSNSNMYLFASHQGGSSINNFAKFKLYYCKIWDGETLIRNFIPCYRKSDNIVGLYDTVNNVFYMNAKTTGDNFVVGPEVK